MQVYEVAELLRQPCREHTPEESPYTYDLAIRQLRLLPNWHLSHDGKRIERVMIVSTFKAGVEFLNHVVDIADGHGHHPDVHIESYKTVRITLWTHTIGGLSLNDFVMAAALDQLVEA